MSSKLVSKKCFQGSPNGPHKLLKIDISVFWRGLQRGPQKGALSRIRKSEISYYLLHFSKVGGLKKNRFVGAILGAFGRQNR